MSSTESQPVAEEMSSSTDPTVAAQDELQAIHQRAIQRQQRLIQILAIPLVAIITGAVVYAVRTATSYDAMHILLPAVALIGTMVALNVWIGPLVKQ